MRLHIIISAQGHIIPFSYQHLLVGCIHKWLGYNDLHGSLSLFCFSRLEGAKATKEGLLFAHEACLFISSFETECIKEIIKGIRSDPTLFMGLIVKEVTIEEDPDMTGRETFYLGSPILIKRRVKNNIEHILFDDPRASDFLKETLQTKMQKAGLKDDTVEVYFDQTYPYAKEMLITYRNIKNKVSWCPVVIKGRPETKLFAWHVGLGNSTGIGFGSLR